MRAVWLVENLGLQLAIPEYLGDIWTVEELNMILVNDLAASGPNSRHHRTFGAILLECERYRRKSKVLLSIQFGCSLFEFVSKIRTQGTLMAMVYTMGRTCD